jgi:hypothetical protein
MRFLRKNTDCRVTVGPFLDKTDGVTPETSLTVTNDHLTLMVDTGDVPTLAVDTVAAASGSAHDMVHVTNDDAGFYDLELAAADINYVGRAMLAITDAANHCPVFHEFMILPAAVYDSLITTGGPVANGLAFASAAYAIVVNSAGAVTVPDAQKVDLNTIKTRAVTDVGSGQTVYFGTSAWSTLTQTSITGGAYDMTNASCIVHADLTKLLTVTLTESSAGYLAAAFKKLFDVATPVLTAASVNQGADSNTILTKLDGMIEVIP